MLKIPQRANTLCGIFAREKCEKATNHGKRHQKTGIFGPVKIYAQNCLQAPAE
jgi:hypothetical protein